MSPGDVDAQDDNALRAISSHILDTNEAFLACS